MPPTPVTAAMEAQKLREENERLKAELAKSKPKALVEFGIIVASKRHDYEANLLTYERDAEGKLTLKEGSTPERPLHKFDQTMHPLILNTVFMQDFLSHRRASIPVYIEEE